MTTPNLVWTLIRVFLWTTVPCHTLSDKPVIHYPKIKDTETLTCNCLGSSCSAVYWFRSFLGNQSLQHLVYFNNADRTTYGAGVDRRRFKVSKKGSAWASFSLRIENVMSEDAAIYSCVLNTNTQEELWTPGILLRPGELPPQSTTVKKPEVKVKPYCLWPKSTKNPKGDCGPMVLLLLVWILLGLAVALFSTLYYFSRLPKKCRHHFVKK